MTGKHFRLALLLLSCSSCSSEDDGCTRRGGGEVLTAQKIYVSRVFLPTSANETRLFRTASPARLHFQVFNKNKKKFHCLELTTQLQVVPEDSETHQVFLLLRYAKLNLVHLRRDDPAPAPSRPNT